MNRVNSRNVWQVSIVVLVSGAALLAAAHTVADPDLWGHVRFGQLILAGGEIPRVDPFSYLTGDHPWINHEWLAEVSFAAAFGLAGPAGLVGLKALLSLGLVGWSYFLLLRRDLDPLRAGILVMFLVALVRIGVATVRPHVFTYVLFFAVLVALDSAERGRPRNLWWLPPIFALWVNLHGGFLAGLGVVVVWAAAVGGARVVSRWRRRNGSREAPRPWVAVPLAAVGVAVLVNPYGPELIDFLLRTATEARPEITEWTPVRIQSVPGVWYVVFLALVVAALVRTRQRLRPGSVAVLGVCAIVPLLAVRHLPLFGLAGIVMGADHFAGVLGRGATGRAETARAREAGPMSPGRSRVAVVLLAGGLALGALAVPRFGCIELEEGYYPIHTVRLLDASGTGGNLAVFFNWGEYVIWHLAPEYRVSMDGRRETVYPDSIYQEHLNFVFGTRDWDAVLDERPTDVALVEWRGPAYNLLTLKPGWELVTRDSVAGLFTRSGWPGRDALRSVIDPRAPPSEARACFP